MRLKPWRKGLRVHESSSSKKDEICFKDLAQSRNQNLRIAIINPYLSDCSIFYDAFKVEIEGRKAHAFLDM